MKGEPSPPPGEDEPALDESFLLQVDRAMLLDKLRDPLRLREVARAAEEEARLAHLADFQRPGWKRNRDADQA